MEKMICKICGKEFEYSKITSCKAQLSQHIKKEHNMPLKDYIIKYEYNGIAPLCPCGCGRELELKKGGHRWEFNKFAADTCIGKMLKEANAEQKKLLKPSLNTVFDLKKYYRIHYDYDTYKKAFELFSSKEWPLTKISKLYNIDKRTLKQIWINLDIADINLINEISDYYRYSMPPITKGEIDVEPEEKYAWMYLVIKNNPGKYTIHSLLDYYNEKHVEKLNVRAYSNYYSLKKIYGDDIDAYLSYGYHSSEEYDFFIILRFYFSNIANSIKMGKRFETEDSYIVYDFFINKTLLIEYDSDEKYHENEKEISQDNYKAIFAKNNGYKFLKLKKEDIKNPETINLIKSLIYD